MILVNKEVMVIPVFKVQRVLRVYQERMVRKEKLVLRVQLVKEVNMDILDLQVEMA